MNFRIADRENTSVAIGDRNILALSDALALLERVPSARVDLCYIDPPLFPNFDDSEKADGDELELKRARAMREHLLALAAVLQQARRSLSAVGNLFVHSEPEMNGSIRLLLDQVFGRKNFCQEIVIPRTARRSAGWPTSGHDTVFHFRVGPDFVFNQQTRELTQDEIGHQYSRSDERGPYRLVSLMSPVTRPSLSFVWRGSEPPPGRSWKFSLERLEQLFAEGRIMASPDREAPQLKQYASDSLGADVGSVWDDIPLFVSDPERTTYPTQKPERLVERLIIMGSNAGGLVLDPFCGSGTTLIAAQKLGRRWIGGDNSIDAIETTTRRIQTVCELKVGVDFLSITETELSAHHPKQDLPPLPRSKNAPFDFVVVDEAQDVSVAQLSFLAALGLHRPNALFFAGDLGQRIFQQPFSWKAVGVDIRGRSRNLRINYRTSHQIRMHADRLLGPSITDIDGNTEDRSDTISLFNGPPPIVHVLETEAEETKVVAAWLTQQSKAGVLPHEFGVFVRSEQQIGRAMATVQAANLPFKTLDEHVETASDHVSISTMHLAKGLEFRAVVVMACDDEIIPLQERIETVGEDSDLQEVYDTERQLLYVACTRARDHLLITSVAPASEFLDDLHLKPSKPEFRGLLL